MNGWTIKCGSCGKTSSMLDWIDTYPEPQLPGHFECPRCKVHLERKGVGARIIGEGENQRVVAEKIKLIVTPTETERNQRPSGNDGHIVIDASVTSFLYDACEKIKGEKTHSGHLYEAYACYCQRNNFPALKYHEFSRAIRFAGYDRYRSGLIYWGDLKVKEYWLKASL